MPGMAEHLYYRHSGSFRITGLAMALVGSLLASLVLAAAYAYLILYIPLAGIVTFLLTGGFAAGVGWVTGALLRRGHVRNMLLGSALALGVALVAWWFHWCTWLFALLHRAGQDVSLVAIALQPGVTWELVRSVNASGAWSLGGFEPTGIALWAIWAIELLVILGVAWLVAHAMIAMEPYCERCESWCPGKPVPMRLAPIDEADARRRAESHDLGALVSMGPPPDDSAWTQLTLHACPRCDRTNSLIVEAITRKVDAKGKENVSKKELVRHLLLSAEEAGRVRAAAPARGAC
jgi:hypothetical protein